MILSNGCMRMDKQILLDLGLSKNEVEVYLALVSLGPSTAVTVAKKAKLHRPNVYGSLDSLTKKSLVSYYTKEKITYYEVIDPEQLMYLLKSKESALQNIIPELKMMKMSALPPSSISILEGVGGARIALADVLENTKRYYALGVPKDYAKIIGEGWIEDWHKNRIAKKIWFHHLVNEDYYSHRVKALKKMEFTTLRFLPKEYGTPNTCIVYDKGVLLSFINPLITIRILNEDIVKSFKNYYKMLDNLAKD